MSLAPPSDSIAVNNGFGKSVFITHQPYSRYNKNRSISNLRILHQKKMIDGDGWSFILKLSEVIPNRLQISR